MPVSFVVSSSPHMHAGTSTRRIMLLVNLALAPAAVASTLIFGWRSLLVMAVSVAACLLTELLSQKVFSRTVTISDGSAVVTGLLFAFVMPATVPLWMVAAGAFTALIRFYGGFSEGVCYSILFMNCLCPLIDRYLVPRRFGAARKAKGG